MGGVSVPLEERVFTLAEIKAAFWKEFHASGELWFDYLGTNEDAESYTVSYWESFCQWLAEPWRPMPDRIAKSRERWGE